MRINDFHLILKLMKQDILRSEAEYLQLFDEENLYDPLSKGLKKVLNNLKREDLLDYGSGRRIKKIKVAKWDITKDGIDNHFIVPKI